MVDYRLTAFRSLLDGAARANGETILANGWDPLPGSQGASEIGAQSRFVGRSKEPVKDAYSLAAIRLGLAAERLAALSRLLDEPPSASASATVARAILETAARASWALDPAIEVKLRIARGRADEIINLLDVLRYPRPEELIREDFEDEDHHLRAVAEFEAFTAEFDKARQTLDEVLADTEAIGLNVIRNRRGRFLGVEERSPGRTPSRASSGTRARLRIAIFQPSSTAA